MAFQRTTAINKLLSLKKRYRIVQGATWAGKTYGIIAVIINWCFLHKNKTATVVAESIPAVTDGAISFFKKIMVETNRWEQHRWNIAKSIYTFPNGTQLQFKSFENEETAKASGKRDLLFLNECFKFKWETADALMSRSTIVWLDFNPVAEFWAHTEVQGKPDADFLKLLTIDNECVPDWVKAEHAERREKAKTSSYWANWCRVYLDGEIGSYEGTLFNRYELKRFSLKELLDQRKKEDKQRYKLAYTDVADKGTDDLAALFAELDNNKVYLTDVVFTPETVNTSIDSVVFTIGQENPIYMRVESNNMGSTYAAWLRDKLEKIKSKTQILDINNSTAKHTRILMQVGFILDYFHFICEEELVPGSDYDKFMKELCRYKKDGTYKRDDAPDACSGLSLMCNSFRKDLFTL